MKTIITSTGNSIESKFDKRFGKASWFCLLDEETGSTRFIENKIDKSQHGACRKAAGVVKEHKATRVISGHFGPNGSEILKKSNIQMVALEEKNLTVHDIINKLT